MADAVGLGRRSAAKGHPRLGVARQMGGAPKADGAAAPRKRTAPGIEGWKADYRGRRLVRSGPPIAMGPSHHRPIAMGWGATSLPAGEAAPSRPRGALPASLALCRPAAFNARAGEDR